MDKIEALLKTGFVLNKGRYQILICEINGTSYVLSCELNRAGFKVEKTTADGKEDTDNAGKYKNTEMWGKIEAVVTMLDANMKDEAPENPVNTEEDVPKKNEWKQGGYKGVVPETTFEEPDHVQEVAYEDVGAQTKISLPKPGRRIKNLESELMEVGTIRAGEKTISSNGKVIPKKTEYFIVTTKTRKNAKDKNEPDLGYEVDEEIHAIVGKEPTKLKVRLPCDREDLNFVTYFGKYKSAVCECRGDNFSAEKSTGEIIECHGVECESFIKGECKKHGVLSVILEDAPRSGVIWKFRTTSRSSISYLDASLALLTGIANGHVASLPLWFTLTPKETTIPSGTQKGKRTTVYVTNLEFRGGYKELETTVRNLISERNGKDTVSSIERVMEAALSLPDSPEESLDIQETFHPDGY